MKTALLLLLLLFATSYVKAQRLVVNLGYQNTKESVTLGIFGLRHYDLDMILLKGSFGFKGGYMIPLYVPGENGFYLGPQFGAYLSADYGFDLVAFLVGFGGGYYRSPLNFGLGLGYNEQESAGYLHIKIGIDIKAGI